MFVREVGGQTRFTLIILIWGLIAISALLEMVAESEIFGKISSTGSLGLLRASRHKKRMQIFDVIYAFLMTGIILQALLRRLNRPAILPITTARRKWKRLYFYKTFISSLGALFVGFIGFSMGAFETFGHYWNTWPAKMPALALTCPSFLTLAHRASQHWDALLNQELPAMHSVVFTLETSAGEKIMQELSFVMMRIGINYAAFGPVILSIWQHILLHALPLDYKNINPMPSTFILITLIELKRSFTRLQSTILKNEWRPEIRPDANHRETNLTNDRTTMPQSVLGSHIQQRRKH